MKPIRLKHVILTPVLLILMAHRLNAQPIAQVAISPYWGGSAVPSRTQASLDKSVDSLYKIWKAIYIQDVPNSDQSFALFFDPDHRERICTSEGQGYGMLITVLMADRDADAKKTFDRLYNYRKAHPSHDKPQMMEWFQRKDGKPAKQSAASDGDIDIAYSLLLAQKKWPSPDSNYQKEGYNMIRGIMKFEINQDQWVVLVGDSEQHIKADKATDTKEYSSDKYYATRLSDFMPATFKEFSVTDKSWLKVADAGYNLIDSLQKYYSPGLGLVPDFVINVNKAKSDAAYANFEESDYDGNYFNNACRVPWRIGLDFLQNGDTSARSFLTSINTFIRASTGDDTSKIFAGYLLNGKSINKDNENFYTAPFAVAAMASKDNQLWLDHLWAFLLAPHKYMKKKKQLDYYGDMIRMLDAIVISGHYWPAYQKPTVAR